MKKRQRQQETALSVQLSSYSAYLEQLRAYRIAHGMPIVPAMQRGRHRAEVTRP